MPLLLQTLDKRGVPLATCGWIWVKRGKLALLRLPRRSERVPENQFVLRYEAPPRGWRSRPTNAAALGSWRILPPFCRRPAPPRFDMAARRSLSLRWLNWGNESLRARYAATVGSARRGRGGDGPRRT